MSTSSSRGRFSVQHTRRVFFLDVHSRFVPILTLLISAAAALPFDARGQSGAAASDTTVYPVLIDVENAVRLGMRDLPGRGVTDAAAMVPGVDRREGADSLALGAFGSYQVAYYLDGVPTLARLPWGAVASIEVYTGHVSAAFGDALSGLVSVTSVGWPARATGGVETLASVGAFDQQVASARAGAPLLDGRLRTFVAGEYEGWTDHSPRARPFVRLRNDLLAETLENPQVPTATGELMPRPYTFSEQDFEEDLARDHNGLRRGTLFAGAEWLPLEILSLSISGRLAAERRDDQPFRFGLFNDQPFSRTERNERGLHAAVALQYSPTASVWLVGDLSESGSDVFHPSFSADVRDVLFYGDIDHPANDVASRYLRYDWDGGGLVSMYPDGAMPRDWGFVNLFDLAGAQSTRFEKSRIRQAYAAAEAAVALRSHRVRLGASVQQQTRRQFRLADPYVPALFHHDGSVESDLGRAVSRYEELSPWVAYDLATYFGYDVLGLRTVSDENMAAFADGQSFDLAPYQPRRYGAFVEDRVGFGPLTLEVGLRLDVFDNNTIVLRDPFSLFPIVRAGDLPQRPKGVGAEYAAYYSADGRLVGYRDLEGRFFDAFGAPAARDLIRSTGSPRAVERTLSRDAFRRSRIRSQLQPRIRAELAILPGTSFVANYDRFARHPMERAHATLRDYVRAMASVAVLNNPDLKPETSILYAVGIRQQIADARLNVRLFMRTYDDLVGLSLRQQVFPHSILTYENHYDATVKGLELSLSLLRMRGLSAAGGYVLQKARGSAIADLPTPVTLFMQEPAPDNLNLDLDRRHQIKLFAAYRVQDGPLVGRMRPFAGLNVSLFADVKSGLPYSTREALLPFWMNHLVRPTALNAARMPWSYLVNLKVQRDFELGRSSLGAFVWIDNLLNLDNVVRVYGTTGQPNDDGYLETPGGRDMADLNGTFEEAFRYYYGLRLADPDHYGIPRIVRLGLDLKF